MPRSFPPDVVVLDTDAMIHARLAAGKSNPRLVQAKTYRLAANTFEQAMVSPRLVNEAALAEALRRLRLESGRWEKVSVLLPDSWFRMNIVDLPSLSERPAEAMSVVRWSLKRTLPIAPEDLRVTYSVLSRKGDSARVLVLSALEATLAAIEMVFAAAGLEIVLIEPVGMNIWNAITVRERETNADRLFLYVRDTDFTTAVFRGSEPLFIRSRNLGTERTIDQEIRLSASYLRDALAVDTFVTCHVAGARAAAVHDMLATEFNTEVRPVVLSDFADDIPLGIEGLDAELTACTGVFTG